MNTHYTIYTKRLCLRLLDLNDAEQLAVAIQESPSLHQWIDWCHKDFTQHEAMDFIGATRVNWVKAVAFGFALFDRKTEQFLGMVALNEFYHTFNMGSLGYWLRDDAQKQGYALEALDALVEFSFANLLLTRLEIVCDPGNTASHRLAERIGATYECLAQNRFIFDGKPKAGLVYSLIPPTR
ncbi:GNAT family N-acetyltransferase [Vibrio mediterranei]|uniref:Ribosomal-protein-serine acetyltransferase n=1 Tax=Vibrio mediterranei TaxID=689 RepID=A0ABX5DE51_9VIBR|nr:GNAT family protein [Vibrio mediterranei]PCD88674.1 ribosomal-protein-serine acetyltransferase [Vibrio mediterranei]PRQ67964.1 ribosomal-protein-serine acetyltransferase [Vibrio mediterranei]